MKRSLGRHYAYILFLIFFGQKCSGKNMKSCTSLSIGVIRCLMLKIKSNKVADQNLYYLKKHSRKIEGKVVYNPNHYLPSKRSGIKRCCALNPNIEIKSPKSLRK